MTVTETYQVAYEAQVGYGEQGSQDIKRYVVQRRHVNHHKVHVDRTNQQDDDAPANFPDPTWWELLF